MAVWIVCWGLKERVECLATETRGVGTAARLWRGSGCGSMDIEYGRDGLVQMRRGLVIWCYWFLLHSNVLVLCCDGTLKLLQEVVAVVLLLRKVWLD